MQKLEDIYNKGFFARRYKLHWRAPHVVDALFAIKSDITSYLDVGCATGDLVFEMDKRSVNAWGIEGAITSKPYAIAERLNILYADLRATIRMGKYDLCSCFEVVEHIEEQYEPILIDNLCSFSNLLVVSAAPPGQGGHHHVNCKPKEYWIEKFRERNFHYLDDLTNEFKQHLAAFKRKDGIRAFYKNTMVLVKS